MLSPFLFHRDKSLPGHPILTCQARWSVTASWSAESPAVLSALCLHGQSSGFACHTAQLLCPTAWPACHICRSPRLEHKWGLPAHGQRLPSHPQVPPAPQDRSCSHGGVFPGGLEDAWKRSLGAHKTRAWPGGGAGFGHLSLWSCRRVPRSQSHAEPSWSPLLLGGRGHTVDGPSHKERKDLQALWMPYRNPVEGARASGFLLTQLLETEVGI